jgi:hypothetical protein
MDIAISSRRDPDRALVWLACCDGRRAWVVTAFPSERQKCARELRKRGALVGEFTTSTDAFRAAWDRLMRPNPDKDSSR